MVRLHAAGFEFTWFCCRLCGDAGDLCAGAILCDGVSTVTRAGRFCRTPFVSSCLFPRGKPPRGQRAGALPGSGRSLSRARHNFHSYRVLHWRVLLRPASALEGAISARASQECARLWNFTCGPIPDERVIPMQLFESAANAVMFAALLTWRLQSPRARAAGLSRRLCRFGSDFWRTASVRPRWGGLSQAQWYAMAVCAVMLVVLAL
jgi:hypothetical protein